jgi:short-subunit dehydrogenase
MKKVVLITGASSGMGKETAYLLAKNGYTVYAAARRVERMQEMQQAGIRILAMDVADDAAMVNGVAAILAAEGRIDVLINNAGFGSYGAMEDVPIETARYQLEVNVFGAARLAQLVLPHMRQQGSGKIVNISSTGGKFATPLGGWYHASKYALEAWSDSMRNEVRPFGIDVILIEPGGVQSEWAGIMMESLLNVSGQGAYQELANRFSGMGEQLQKNLVPPSVIAELMLKAITVRKPKARYTAGYLAKPLLFLKWLLSDRRFDQLLMSQLKS